MSPREVLHRIAEQRTLWSMRYKHWSGYRWSDHAGVNIDQYRFCVTDKQLPELPWAFEPDDKEIDDLLVGKGNALGFYWNWHPEEFIWHRAPDTKKVWPKKFFGTINYREGNPYGDIRIAWEPSRLQHFIALALLAWREPDLADRAVLLLEKQFLSWIEDNPPFTGIHYISAMECSLRILSVCHALDIVRDKLHKPEKIWRALIQMVESHAHFIEKRLSLHSSVGNHTIAECAGLIYAGLLFPEIEGAKRWKSLGLSILQQEADHQIMKDGGGIEQSFWYLLFILDLYGLVLKLLKHQNEVIPSVFEDAVCSGKQFMCSLADVPTKLPAVGDSDSGYALSPYLRLNWIESKLPTDTINFSGTGYSLIRNSGKVPFTLLFDHGPLGMQPSYGHGHADALSIILNVSEEELLIDSGTYTYTGDSKWRAYFRGTRAHNTVIIDDLDQAKQVTSFQWSHAFQSELVRHKKTVEGDVLLLARHNGYSRIGVIHWRGVLYQPSGFVLIWDYLTGHGTHTMELNWHFGIEPVEKNGIYKLSVASQAVLLEVEGGRISLHRGEVEPICGWKSRTYGLKVPITTLQAFCKGPLPRQFVTKIVMDSTLDTMPSIENELSIMRQWIYEAEAG